MQSSAHRATCLATSAESRVPVARWPRSSTTVVAILDIIQKDGGGLPQRSILLVWRNHAGDPVRQLLIVIKQLTGQQGAVNFTISSGNRGSGNQKQAPLFSGSVGGNSML